MILITRAEDPASTGTVPVPSNAFLSFSQKTMYVGGVNVGKVLLVMVPLSSTVERVPW